MVLPIPGWPANPMGRKRLLLRTRHFALAADQVSRAARAYRRRIAAACSGDSSGNLSQATAWACHGGFWHRNFADTDPRTDFGPMDHRQLLLALDLLSQPAGRRSFPFLMNELVFDPHYAKRSAHEQRCFPRTIQCLKMTAASALFSQNRTGKMRLKNRIIGCFTCVPFAVRRPALHAGAHLRTPYLTGG
jgi:hypothetical protein